ncbi:ferric siderophore ABC transporter substrate-binding protein [Riemerella anatipestifer]|uniref:ferric siderophore ABC transporter substrate-binding protein n=1 Tax=Riemerella anatipestifer TaxID=34085 RepID=UPI002A8B7ED2|nr:ferric siderophore ABC transporter substrate-binding protein [Riemerella anatipestifer]
MSQTINTSERKDQIKSAIITFLISLLVFLALYFYSFTRELPKEEVVSTMLINFGDQNEGNLPEEPQNQEGSLSATEAPTPIQKIQPTPVEPQPKKEVVKEKIITGQNTKTSAEKVEKVTSKPTKESTANTQKKETTTPKKSSTTTQNKTVTNQGDGRGNEAIGNLIRGRGANKGAQGNSQNTSGNSGDPLGGDSNGDSKIGIDRKLIGFIPGTMGRGGSQPTHQCSASGTISISYVVDKAGNVISARRSGGITDPCAVNTTIEWVKKYVKAERANTSSTGTYKITF